jgi:hypothetical protein
VGAKSIHDSNGIGTIGYFKYGDYHSAVALNLIGVEVAVDVAVGTAVEGKVGTNGRGEIAGIDVANRSLPSGDLSIGGAYPSEVSWIITVVPNPGVGHYFCGAHCAPSIQGICSV